MRITRPISTDIRRGLTFEHRWEGEDLGLITSWERGRDMACGNHQLAAAAIAGELVMLPFKGGVDKTLKAGRKYGSLHYLAMWQGLRGENLDIDTATEPFKVCKKYGVMVVFTLDASKTEP